MTGVMRGPQRDTLGRLRWLPDHRGGQTCLGCTLGAGGLALHTSSGEDGPCTPHLGKTAAPPELLGLTMC